MQKRLFIAGDSFASLSPKQEKGASWSERLAANLDSELVNISRPGASNTTIAIQIDWITSQIQSNDYIVVLLTDRYRQTLPNPNNPTVSDKPLLERHSVHYSQLPYDGIEYSDPAELTSSLMSTFHPETQDYYKNWFDPELVHFQDKMIITGALSFLLKKSTNLLVVSGGFGLGSSSEITNTDFNLEPKMFCNFSADRMKQLGTDKERGNHLDDYAHIQLANLFLKKIENKG